jgi:MarR family transcriptional regulator, organic hydroperoxide resistance regulator
MTPSAASQFLQAIQLAEKAVSRERYRRLAAMDLTIAQAQILLILKTQEPLSLNDLASELLTDTPPSRVVSALVDRGWVSRKDQSNDRRRVELSLTTSGAEKIADIRRTNQAINRWAAKRLKGMPVVAASKSLSALTHE